MQLLFVFIFSVGLPVLGLIVLRGIEILDEPSSAVSLGASFAAALVSLVSLRRIRSYFGALISKWILPIYTGSLLLFIAPVFFFRAPFSSVLLTLCVVTSFLSFYVLAALMVRGRRATCYIIPAGRALDFELDWDLPMKVMDEAYLPDDTNAIFVADLHCDIGEEWEYLLTEAALKGHPVYHFTQLREAMTGRVQFEHLSENSFGSMIPAVPYGKIKRAFDLMLVVIALPLLLPFLMLLALAIKIDSNGPAVFRQKRMGFRGRFFYIFKFRTMTVTEDGSHLQASITRHNDERITRIGGLLRRTRIDELPQIWNIIKGEMSWIGPRPEALGLSAAYEADLPYYRYRHVVRPGISGWAQVHQGHVSSMDEVNEKLQYDFYYVKNISFWLDMVIALRTVRVILSGFGAK
jgi:lipopolysaccharide/colanic/teichoic acid biosynthesis glycosyltransferase